ncbi:hypothetical protein F5Y19DRAFT_429370 [Xylariaceae sp. FL1651]|nr:hypothetical protein F5Y19DRAFT_429370 [Xylariaceae sp. FL1651]
MHSFESIPWCAALLQKPGVIIFTPSARLPAGPDGHLPSQDQFFKTTLKTTDAVPEYIGFYQSPFSDSAKENLTSPSSPSARQGPRFFINTASLLIDLRPGVNGFNATAHGGLIASLFDEVMGNLIFMENEVQNEARDRGVPLSENIVNLRESAIFTASMNIKLIKPLITPEVVIATATLNGKEGRKLFLGYTIKNGDGIEFARGEAVWIAVRKEKL